MLLKHFLSTSSELSLLSTCALCRLVFARKRTQQKLSFGMRMLDSANVLDKIIQLPKCLN